MSAAFLSFCHKQELAVIVINDNISIPETEFICPQLGLEIKGEEHFVGSRLSGRICRYEKQSTRWPMRELERAVARGRNDLRNLSSNSRCVTTQFVTAAPRVGHPFAPTPFLLSLPSR